MCKINLEILNLDNFFSKKKKKENKLLRLIGCNPKAGKKGEQK